MNLIKLIAELPLKLTLLFVGFGKILSFEAEETLETPVIITILACV